MYICFTAIFFLFSCNSFSNFLYKLSKITLSLLNESIYYLNYLFIAMASLNFWFALSNLFSNIFICLANEDSFSAPALYPPCYYLIFFYFFINFKKNKFFCLPFIFYFFLKIF